VTDYADIGEGRSARILDPTSGLTRRTLALHPECLASISPDGTRVAYTRPGPVFVVEGIDDDAAAAGGARLRDVVVDHTAVVGGRWLADGRHFLAIEVYRRSTRLSLWDLDRRARIAVPAPLLQPELLTKIVDCSADGGRIGTFVAGGKLLVRAAGTPGQRVVSTARDTRARALAFGCGGRAIARRSLHGRLDVWPVSRGDSTVGRATLEEGVKDVVGTDDGFAVLTDVGVARWRAGEERARPAFDLPAGAQARLVEGGGALVRTGEGHYELRSPRGDLVLARDLSGRAEGELFRVSPDGRLLVESRDDREDALELVDLETGPVRPLDASTRNVSPWHMTFADGAISYVIPSDDRVITVRSEEGVVGAYPLSGPTRQIIGGGATDTFVIIGLRGLQVRDRETGRLVYGSPYPEGFLLAISDDGRWLARVGLDWHVHLHDLTIAGTSPVAATR